MPASPHTAGRSPSTTLGPALPIGFYERPVLEVARGCIGKILSHRTAAGLVAGRIVEAEAYRGPEDRAAHSYGGRRTARTEVMFGPAGRAYVFLIYGMHWNFNIVTGAIGSPEAVLIRAIEPLIGLDLMAGRRRLAAHRKELTNGPGKLCQAFGINRDQYGVNLTRSGLRLHEAPVPRVRRSPRIGIDYAGAWAKKPWRFFDPESTYVSQGPRKRLRP